MKTSSTYVVVHDKNIILDYINNNKFVKFNNLHYIFVGNNFTDKIKNYNNIIFANTFTDNIEHIPKFTAFTAWYILYKNPSLIKTDYINLFEYDVNIHPNFITKNNELINRDDSPEYVGYFPTSINHHFFINYTDFSDALINVLKTKYNLDVYELVNSLNQKYKNMLWSASNNCTWRVDKFNEYMGWFIPLISDLQNNKFCGHMQERSVSIYFLFKKLNVLLLPNYIEHFHLNTHGTSLAPQSVFTDYYPSLLQG